MAVYPSPKMSDNIVEPYNATLSINLLIDNSDICVNIDNEALYNISRTYTKKVNYSLINQSISNMITGLSAPMRFPGQLNTNLLKLAVNLIAFPRLHFLVVAFSPLDIIDSKVAHGNYREVVEKMMFNSNKGHLMASVNPRDGRFFTGSFIFRGDIATSEAEELMFGFKKSNP